MVEGDHTLEWHNDAGYLFETRPTGTDLDIYDVTIAAMSSRISISQCSWPTEFDEEGEARSLSVVG